MTNTVTDQAEGAIHVAEQFVALAAQVATPFLSVQQTAAIGLAQTALRLLVQSIEQQIDIDEVTWGQLDADEASILAAVAKAQSAAQAKADAELRAGGG